MIEIVFNVKGDPFIRIFLLLSFQLSSVPSSNSTKHGNIRHSNFSEGHTPARIKVNLCQLVYDTGYSILLVTYLSADMVPFNIISYKCFISGSL